MTTTGIAYPYTAPPVPGDTLAVADGVYWIRMPLPFALDHINLWLLEDDGDWVIVDTGLNTAEIKTLWTSLLEGPLLANRVGALVVTHYHPDHFGLGGWLHERTGALVTITQTEWLTAQYLYNDEDGAINDHMVAFYAGHGLDQDSQRQLRAAGNRYRRVVSRPPLTHRVIRDGEVLRIGGRDWRIIVGRGHAPEHACLYCREAGLMIAGDQILPKISPNVMLTAAQPLADPLRDYLESFAAFTALEPDTLVLPTHGRPFYGLAARIAQLETHHHERLTLLLEHLAQPHSAAELLPVLFRRKMDAHHLMFAMGETLAHLAYLRTGGDIAEQHREEITYFRRTARGVAA